MRVVTSREMLTIEEQAEALFGLSTGLLMERAGQAVADEAKSMLPNLGHVLIVCGKGNNGGDGFVAARLLSDEGYRVTVFSLAQRDNFPPAARDAFNRIPAAVTLITNLDLTLLDNAILRSDLVIDAIFGFSLKGAVRGAAVDVIDRINLSQRPILSVDMPSGLEADTGAVHDRGVVADVTVTFTTPKVGMLLYPGFEYTGEIVVVDIGIPDSLVEEHSAHRQLERAEIRGLFPVRAPNAHKKSVGQVLLIAGSVGMAGAAALTAKAAYRAGAGIVAFAPPESIVPILNSVLIEAILYPQPETVTGTLAAGAYDALVDIASSYDVVAIGPGLSANGETVELVRRLVADIEKPMVIDADGLNALVGATDILTTRRAETVITPHPGEMARLFGASTGDILSDWLGFARRASEELGVTAVLKGPRTIIASQHETVINTTGNPGLATAGTGDVLTGVIAALMAQGMSAYDAASVGVYLHGIAADIAVEDLNEYSLVASDLIDYLPEAINEILG